MTSTGDPEITKFLEMRSPQDLRPARTTTDLEVRPVVIPVAEFSKFLWFAVGTAWAWNSRAAWTADDWSELGADSSAHTWVGYIEGSPAGYFELKQDAGGDVEIRWFGLLPQFIGYGYGGHLLTEAVRRAWELDAPRVWVHTCNYDGPHAVANYLARGFIQYEETVGPPPVLPVAAQPF